MRAGIVGVGALLLITACGGGGESPTTPGPGPDPPPLVHAKRVTMESFAFSPAIQTIPAGDTIYFTFSSVAHTVTFARPTGLNGVPANTGTQSNVTIKRVFPNAGTFDYVCELHASMTGQIVAQ